MSRQTKLPPRWMIVDGADDDLLRALKLPLRSGLLVLAHHLPSGERTALLRQLRRHARSKGLTIIDEASGAAARVHNSAELRRALLRRSRLILLSPLYATRSHPGWRALPRMRAAALARLGRRRLIALGGMGERRFNGLSRLGFVGWAGISAWKQRAL